MSTDQPAATLSEAGRGDAADDAACQAGELDASPVLTRLPDGAAVTLDVLATERRYLDVLRNGADR